MTQVIRVLPIWYDQTAIPRPKRKHPGRGFSDQRQRHGGRSRLTDDDVRSIRLAGEWDWPRDLVARLFGITEQYVYVVMRGESHAHVR